MCARQIWILSEGVIALTMIHGDKRYCAAAEAAALAVIARPTHDQCSWVEWELPRSVAGLYTAEE
jgi:hypothetical protein